jgi:Bax protein
MNNSLSKFKPQILYTVLIFGLFFVALHMKPLMRTVLVVPEPVVEVVIRNVPDFGAILDVQLKKQTFFSYLQPYIDQENREILRQREILKLIQAKLLSGNAISTQESNSLERFSLNYELESANLLSGSHLQRLLKRIDVIPTSLVLAQAANESAWGSSRFAQAGNNFFGQWCYTEGCGIIPTRRRADATHEVRSFDGVGESVHAYFMNINTFPSYENLREIREELRNDNHIIDGISLTEGLESYSERGDDYIWELQSMIYSNNLIRLDEV